MRLRYIVVAVALVSSVVTWATAQVVQRPIFPITQPTVTGENLGFVVDMADGTAVGRLVIQVNGVWREAEIALPRARTLPLVA